MLTDKDYWDREQLFDAVYDALEKRGVKFRDQRDIVDESEAGTLYGDDVFQFVIDNWPTEKTASQIADDLLAATKFQDN